MKKLIIISHPDIENSVINKRWVEELEKFPDLYTVHKLYSSYPDGVIDIKKEQELVDQYDTIILQYPLYWFNCPPLLKQWLDEVFTYGWAYGSKGNNLKDKKFALAISAGGEEDDFKENSPLQITSEQLIAPFKSTFIYTKSDFKGSFFLYDTDNIVKDQNAFDKKVQEYLSFLSRL